MTLPTHCRECGSPIVQIPITKQGHRPREFCSATCRVAFRNRRAKRGAELFDFYMASRYQRQQFPGLITTVNQMCAGWREEDKKILDGRQSWNDISRSDR